MGKKAKLGRRLVSQAECRQKRRAERHNRQDQPDKRRDEPGNHPRPAHRHPIDPPIKHVYAPNYPPG